MAHIHTEPGQHDFTVSAYIINPAKRSVLLHRHKLLGIWVQPGGHIELEENPWEALTHELLEETGYDITSLKVLQPSMQFEGLVETVHPTPLVYRTHHFPSIQGNHLHTDAAYGFIASGDPTSPVGESESHELQWFTSEELKALTEDSVVADTRTISIQLLQTFNRYRWVPSSRFQ